MGGFAPGNNLCLLALLLNAIYGHNIGSVRKKEILVSDPWQILDIDRLLYRNIEKRLSQFRNQTFPNWKFHSRKGVHSGRVSEAVTDKTEQQDDDVNTKTSAAEATLPDALLETFWQSSVASVMNENPKSSIVFVNTQSSQTRTSHLRSLLPDTLQQARVRIIRKKANWPSGNLTADYFEKQPTPKLASLNYASRQIRWTNHRKQKRYVNLFSLNSRRKRSTKMSKTGPGAVGPLQLVQDARCSTDQIALRLALQSGQQWAQQMADSSAHLGAGPIDYMGLHGECLSVSVPAFQGFQPHYCVLTFNSYQVSPYPPRLPIGQFAGLCVPDTCQREDVIAIFRKNAGHADLKDLDIQRVSCSSQDSKTVKAEAAGVLTFLGLWTLLVLVASVLQVFCGKVVSVSLPRQRQPRTHRVRYRRKREEERECLLPADDSADSSTVEIDIDSDSDSPRLQQPQRLNYGTVSRKMCSQRSRQTCEIIRMQLNISLVRSVQLFRKQELSYLRQLLRCFSLELNFQNLLDTNMAETEIACLHGVRCFSLAWVVLLNCITYQFTYTRNAVQLLENWRKHSLMYSFIDDGNLALDSLFTISGLLVGYVYCHRMDAQMDRMKWVIHIVIRYMRIIPSMAIVGIMYVSVFPVVVDGPMLIDTAPDQDVCMKRGWMNALLLQNFASPVCMSWTWFLALDFQFFLFTPFLIRLLYYRPRLAYVFVFLLVLVSWVVSGALTLVHDLPVTRFVFPNPENVTYSVIKETAFTSYYLYKPWSHAGSFFPPLLVGYLLHRCNLRASFRIRTAVAGWLGALVGAMTVLCAVNKEMVTAAGERSNDLGTRVVYNASRSTLWSLCVCWVVLACSTGYGGPVNSLLGWQGWKPLSRLVFLTYLVHPVVIVVNTACLEQSLYMTTSVAAYQYLGVLVYSFLVSSLLALFWEMPLNALLSWAISCCVSGSKHLK